MKHKNLKTRLNTLKKHIGLSYYGCLFDGDIDDARKEKFIKQLEERGFDDTETWSLDYTIARFVLPRLKRFQEIKGGYPPELTEKKWTAVINKMIAAFELIIKDNFKGLTKAEFTKVEKGLALFAQYFQHLWW